MQLLVFARYNSNMKKEEEKQEEVKEVEKEEVKETKAEKVLTVDLEKELEELRKFKIETEAKEKPVKEAVNTSETFFSKKERTIKQVKSKDEEIWDEVMQGGGFKRASEF